MPKGEWERQFDNGEIKVSLRRHFDLAYNWGNIFHYGIGKMKRNNFKFFNENQIAKNETPDTKNFLSFPVVGERPACLKDNTQK